MSTLNKRIQFMRPRANGRSPSKYPTDGAGVPLRITRLFPMKLKDTSVNSLRDSNKVTDVVCLNEMMNLFDCFEKNDFDRTPCQQHAQVLENCYSAHLAAKEERRLKRAKAES